MKSTVSFILLLTLLPNSARSESTICHGMEDAEVHRRLDEMTNMLTCSMDMTMANCQLMTAAGVGAVVLGGSAVAAMLKNNRAVCNIPEAVSFLNLILPRAHAVQLCYQPRNFNPRTGMANPASPGQVAFSAKMYYEALDEDAVRVTKEAEDYISNNWRSARTSLTLDVNGAAARSLLESRANISPRAYDVLQQYVWRYPSVADADAAEELKKFDEALKKELTPSQYEQYKRELSRASERAKNIRNVLAHAEAGNNSKVKVRWSANEKKMFPRVAGYLEHVEVKEEMPKYRQRYLEVQKKLLSVTPGTPKESLEFLSTERVHTTSGAKSNLHILRSQLNSDYMSAFGGRRGVEAARASAAKNAGMSRWQAYLGARGVGLRGLSAASIGRSLAFGSAGLAIQGVTYASALGCGQARSPYEHVTKECDFIPDLTPEFVDFLTLDPDERVAALKEHKTLCNAMNLTYDNVAGQWNLQCQSDGFMMTNTKHPQRAVQLKQDSEGHPLSVKMLFEKGTTFDNFQIDFDSAGQPEKVSRSNRKYSVNSTPVTDFDPAKNQYRQWKGMDFSTYRLDAKGWSASAFRREIEDEMAQYHFRLAQISAAQLCCIDAEAAGSACQSFKISRSSGPSTRGSSRSGEAVERATK